MWENEYACLPSVSFRVPSSLNVPPRDHFILCVDHGFFRCIVVFFRRFLERWCVCGRCFFVLSNIVNYRKKNLYSSTNCDSENASPILVENPRSLRESLKNYYPVAEKNVARPEGVRIIPEKQGSLCFDSTDCRGEL